MSEHIVPTRLFSDWELLLHSRIDQASARQISARSAPEAIKNHVEALVRLALNADDIGLNAFIASLADQGWTGNALVKLLIEPTARSLGDAWLTDDCSEFDLTIRLSILQLAGHAACFSERPEVIRGTRYSILLATAPGKQHMLRASLLADQFTDVGCQVDMAFPESDEALANQLRAQHPDAVDIGLSDALVRRHALERLRGTIDHSRLVVPGQLTVVSVGGCLLAEALATAASVGADHARMTAAGASMRMSELVRQSRVRRKGPD